MPIATQAELYPPNPREVPPDLTAPTPAYERRAWLAFGGLVVFVGLYLGLTVYLGWLSFRLIYDAVTGGSAFFGLLAAALPALFFGFLVRGLFLVKHRRDESLVEVTPDDQPELFRFVHRIADETGAPRPHRVFLSARVNAAVFYDLSFWNLIWPSRKNLEIGLGLVEVLSLDEIKAVVAHEFGHFAQRTMAVGRWVYIAHQIAGHVIVSRGWLDRMLHGLSGFDIRIAWIGWILRLLVWALRAVLDTFFLLVIHAHSALSREMELQADLVAVSVSGSDSLIHALHKLGAADDAWDRASRLAIGELGRKRQIDDLFTLQRHILEHLRAILDDAAFGETPARPERRRESHRVFDQELALPPRMWSTHPPSREREDNAKRIYLDSKLDPRPAWALFTDAPGLRRRVTERFLETVIPEGERAPVPMEEVLAKVDEDYGRPMLDRRYRGAYLGRSVVESARGVRDCFDDCDEELDRDEVIARLDALYPEQLVHDLESFKDLTREKQMLTALQDGVLDAPGGVIHHRGAEIPKKKLAAVVESVEEERREAEARVVAHDRAARTAHRLAARQLGPAWEDHHVSLVRLLHYADHTSANLADGADYLHHVFSIVIVDGHVSGSERRRLRSAAEDLYAPLERAFAERDQVVLPDAVLERLEVEGWSQRLDGPFELPPPTESNLGDWLQASDSWALGASDAFRHLAGVTLEALLEVEERIAAAVREGDDPGPAPAAALVPPEYRSFVVGEERERQKKLGWWERFVIADGWVPGTARFAVASAVLVPALMLGGSTGGATLHVHNGLGVGVVVQVGEEQRFVLPHASQRLDVDTGEVTLEARTRSGELVERFDADVDHAFRDYVYNVAGASALVEWTVSYGYDVPANEVALGAPRWSDTSVDFVLQEPPSQLRVSSRSSGTTRDVLTAIEGDASTHMQYVEDEAERRALVEAHLRWDPSSSPELGAWIAYMTHSPDATSIVRERARREPDVLFWRYLLASDDDPAVKAAACEGVRDATPESGDDAYLAAACAPDRDARHLAYEAAHAQYPDNAWLSMAAAYGAVSRGAWREAASLLMRARTPATAALWRSMAWDLARVRRATWGEADELPELAEGMPMLRSYLAVERAVEVSPEEAEALAPWRALARGRLHEALRSRLADEPVFLRLVAASEGAPPEALVRAAALPATEGVGPTTLWTALALARREGWESDALVAEARASGEEGEALLELLDDPDRMDAVVARLRAPALVGQAYAMGVVLRGSAAPAEWRTGASRLLFAVERPFFR